MDYFTYLTEILILQLFLVHAYALARDKKSSKR